MSRTVEGLTKILVIDPDARACRALREVLDDAGFSTVGAHTEARARALMAESPRPVALVVGASDPFWRDGMVHDFRSYERDLVIVPLLLPGDEYEALLEMGASACASASAVDTQLAPLLRRMLQVRRVRPIATTPPPPIVGARVESGPRAVDRLPSPPVSASRTPVEVRVRTWDEYAAIAPQLKRGSLFVETTAPGQVADEVRVRIVVPDGRSVELAAEIGNVVSRERAAATGKPAGMGVRFVELGDAEQHALASFEQSFRAEVSPSGSSGERARVPTADPASVGRATPVPARFAVPRTATPVPRTATPVPSSVEPDRRRVPTEPAVERAPSATVGLRFASPRHDARAPTQPGPVARAERLPSDPTPDARSDRSPTAPGPTAGVARVATPVPSTPPPPPRNSVPPPRAGAPRDPALGGGRTKAEVLRDHLAELQRSDYFTALGVTPDLDAESLRLAFVTLAKKWHPNKFATDGPEIRALATEIFITLKKARDTLADPKKLATHRARYEAAANTQGARRPDDVRVGSPVIDVESNKARGGR